MVIGKRAQTELLGFVMVVAIISIALLFVIGFLAASSQVDVRSNFIDKQLAINLNDAMLETSTTCRGIKVKALLLNCAQSQNFACGDKTPCEFLREDVFPELLDLTLGEQGRNNSFTYRACIQKPGVATECYVKPFDAADSMQLINVTNGDCSKLSTTPGIFPLPTRGGEVVYSVLNVCR